MRSPTKSCEIFGPDSAACDGQRPCPIGADGRGRSGLPEGADRLLGGLVRLAVDHFIESIVQQTGSLDIEFNATGPRISEYGNGKRAVELPINEFMVAVDTVLQSQFITARAAARQMLNQGSGVIIFLTGSPARPHGPGTAAIGAPFGAVENLMRTMAIELGPSAVRVVCLRTAANPIRGRSRKRPT